jgi:hypothetical protein
MKTLNKQFTKLVRTYMNGRYDQEQKLCIQKLLDIVKAHDKYSIGRKTAVKESYPLHQKNMIMKQNAIREEIIGRQEESRGEGIK